MDELISDLERDLSNNAEYISCIKNPRMLISSLKDLQNMIGHQQLKDDVANQVDVLISHLYRKEEDSIMLHTLLYGNPGVGKCLAIDTPVLMFDGSIKMSQNVAVNDILMGDDSTARKVGSITRGREKMYRIYQEYGDNYVVNRSHILSLKLVESPKRIGERAVRWVTSKSVEYKEFSSLSLREQHISSLPTAGDILDVSIEDYITRDDEWKKAFKGYKVSIDFPHRFTERNPYNIGLSILNFNSIPKEYLVNSRKIRLLLLAGILDSIGYHDNDCLCIKTDIAEEMLFLIRSLGIRSNKTLYFKQNNIEIHEVRMWGNLADIPSVIFKNMIASHNQDNLCYDIKIEELEEGDYFGFEIDGNRRFLLGDLTVTHNTTIGKHLAKIWNSLGFLGRSTNKPQEFTSSTDKTKNDFWKSISDGSGLDTAMMLMTILYVILIISAVWGFVSNTVRGCYNMLGLRKFLIVIIILFIVMAIVILYYYYYHSTTSSIRCARCLEYKCICSDKIPPTDDLIQIVSSEDFIDKYVGWTEAKTTKLLQSCKGKVLFIDEAYSLIGSSMFGDNYGEKALNIINRYMSEHPEDLIIIMAGYEHKIKEGIFRVQPGLIGRFMWSFNCKEYNIEELFNIWKQQSLPKKVFNEAKALEIFRKHEKCFPNNARDTLRLVNFVKLAGVGKSKKSRYEKLSKKSDVISLDQLERGFAILERNLTSENENNKKIINEWI